MPVHGVTLTDSTDCSLVRLMRQSGSGGGNRDLSVGMPGLDCLDKRWTLIRDPRTQGECFSPQAPGRHVQEQRCQHSLREGTSGILLANFLVMKKTDKADGCGLPALS